MANYLIKHFMNLICSIYVLKNARLFSFFSEGPRVLVLLASQTRLLSRKLGDQHPTPTPATGLLLPPTPPPGSPVSRRREHGD